MKRNSKSSGAIVLLGGVLLLLYQLNILGYKIVKALMIFWPIFIIVIGLDIVLRNRTIKIAAWAIAFCIVIYFSVFGDDYDFYSAQLADFEEAKTIDIKDIEYRQYPKTEQEQGNLEMSSFSQKIAVKSTSDADIVTGESIAFEADRHAREIDYSCDAFHVKQSADDGTAPLYLSADKFWQLDFSSASIDLIVDDRALTISDMTCSAAEIALDYSFSGDYYTHLQIDAFKADVTVRVDPKMPLKIKTDSIYRDFTVDGKEIKQNIYLSETYERGKPCALVIVDALNSNINVIYRTD